MLQHLVGQICWKAIPGEEDLTTLYLSLGEEIGRHPSRFRPEIPIIERQFSMCTSSAWRLDGPDRVLCSRDDEKPRGGEVRQLLAELEGQNVLRVEFTPPAGDLAIQFERGQVLRLFCCVREGDRSYTWDYWFNDKTPQQEQAFSVGPRGAINFNWPDSEHPAPATGI